MKCFAGKRGLASLFLIVSLAHFGAKGIGAHGSASEPLAKVRLSINLGGSPLPPQSVGLKLGDQVGTPDPNRDMDMWVDAPGNYEVGLTGNAECRITRIQSKGAGDKIAVSGSERPTLHLYAGARDQYRIFLELTCQSDGRAEAPTPKTAANTASDAASGDLTGTWRNPGGKAIYRLRQIGPKVVWLVDAVSLGSYANVFRGRLSGNTIDGTWDDLPGSPTIGGGRMQLRVESDCRITRVSSVNQHGADVWVRIGSRCDTAN